MGEKVNVLQVYDVRHLKVYLPPFIEIMSPQAGFFIYCVTFDSLRNDKKKFGKKVMYRYKKWHILLVVR